MKLSRRLSDYLVSEFHTCAESVRAAGNDHIAGLYWFSAAHGAVQRVLNIEYQPQLPLLFWVLQTAHTQIAARVNAIREGRDVPRLNPDFFQKLAGFTEELAERVKAEKDFGDVLESIATLTYATTGNGFYLQQTGRLKF